MEVHMPLETKIVKKGDYIYLVELNGTIDTATHEELKEKPVLGFWDD